MSIVSDGKGSYRARLNRMVHAAAYVGSETFPRGQEYFASLVPLTGEERAQHWKDKEAREYEALSASWNDEADMRFAWAAGFVLVVLYASLEVGLSVWLLGLGW